jgi:hypothetical protein
MTKIGICNSCRRERCDLANERETVGHQGGNVLAESQGARAQRVVSAILNVVLCPWVSGQLRS